MPWTDIARIDHNRKTSRYPSDMTDAEWMLVAPLLPAPRSGGRPRTVDLREVMNAILYIGSTGCQWRALPRDFPPMTTVQGYFYDWRDSGVFEAVNALLVMSARELEGREASPTAGVIDSQSVKTTESGGVCGYDAGKKIKGRKRHILTDTLGLLLFVIVHGADVQDRDGAPEVLKAVRYRFPWLRHIFADGGYAGAKLPGLSRERGSGRSKSSNVQMPQRGSRYCRAGGWSSAPSHGSDVAAVWQRTGNARPKAPRLGP